MNSEEIERCALAHRIRWRIEFKRPYVGGDVAPKQLEDYITSCAVRAAESPSQFPLPLIALAQSSGSGKSRLLRELALRTKDDPCGPMKVLYTCVRPQRIARNWYPHATNNLRDHLFPRVGSEKTLRRRLWRLFACAAEHWTTIGPAWFSLFVAQDDDGRIGNQLLAYTDRAVQLEQAEHAQQTDQVEEVGQVGPTTRTEVSDGALHPRRLVLAIDDARFLDTQGPRNWSRRLGRVLVRLAPRIRATFGADACLFVVLVDSSPAIIPVASELMLKTPTMPPHRSSGKASEPTLFPPFVLSHTFDNRFDAVGNEAIQAGQSRRQFYQGLVASTYEDACATFVAMGRPAWDRVLLVNASEPERPVFLILDAADWSIGGAGAEKARTLSHETEFGVASVLCRVGLSASSSAPLASHAVADLMATLAYVTTTHGQRQLVTSYPSEPLLAFGAAAIWYSGYGIHPDLADDIIPHFRKLLSDGQVSAGQRDRGTVVGRLLLLFVMYATGIALAPATNPFSSDTAYTGESTASKRTCVFYTEHKRSLYATRSNMT